MLFSRLAHQLIAVGYEQANKIRNTLRLPSSSIDTIYNGVESPEINLDNNMTAAYRKKPGNPVIIGSISTLTEQKGLTYLLDVADILHRKKSTVFFLLLEMVLYVRS